MTEQIPEGWYADPQRQVPGAERWWNGVQWTAHTRQADPAPAPPSPAAAGSQAAPGTRVGSPTSALPAGPKPPRRLPDGTPLPDVGTRIGGYVVDVVLVAVVGSVVAGILAIALEISSSAVSDVLPGPWFVWSPSPKPVVLILLWMLYQVVTRGHTVGKRVFGLRLRLWDGDGEVSRTQVLRRSFVGSGGLLVLALPVGGILGVALAAYDTFVMSQDPSSRAWHDQLAGTVVVSTRS